MKKCLMCGKLFEPKGKRKNHCSEQCMLNHRIIKHREFDKIWRQKTPIRQHLKAIFSLMKIRCYDESYKEYYLYGGRGIKICDEWMEKKKGFPRFYNWSINNGYQLKQLNGRNTITIDRIDVNKGYSPENCRWVDNATQSRNKRVSPKSKTGVSGVQEYKNKYRVTISVNNKQKHIGLYSKIEDAIDARMKAEELYWGKEYGYNRRNEK